MQMTPLRNTENFFSPWLRDFPMLFANPFQMTMMRDPIRVDVREHEDSYIIEAEVSGCHKDGLEVSIDGNKVRIVGRFQNGNGSVTTDKILKGERFVGTAERSLELPDVIDETRSTARYDNGLLTLELVKVGKKPPTTLEIH
jgi:HSP20 family protein